MSTGIDPQNDRNGSKAAELRPSNPRPELGVEQSKSVGTSAYHPKLAVGGTSAEGALIAEAVEEVV